MIRAIPIVAFAYIMVLIAGLPAMAQTQTDPHHPPGNTTSPQNPPAAQPRAGGGPMSGQPGAPGMMMMQGCGMPMMGMMEPAKSRIEGRLGFLKAELKITAQQEEAWKAYSGTVRAIDQRMIGMMGAMGAGGMMMEKMKGKSVPEALQMHIQMMQTHLDDLKALQVATVQFYAVLADIQKKTADELLGMPCGMGSK